MRRKEEFTIIDAIKNCSSTFQSLNSTIHMVLFADGKLYDFLPVKRQIRPYNVSTWIQISNSRYDKLFEYLESIYDNIIDQHNTGEDIDFDICIGYKMDSILAIDMEKVINFLLCMLDNFQGPEILFNEQELQKISEESLTLAEQAKNLMNTLSGIYDTFEQALQCVNISDI